VLKDVKIKFTHHKGNRKVFFDSIQTVQFAVLNRKRQLEKALASEPAQKKRETICCSIMYLPNL